MPVGPYDTFDECVADNQDKDDPEAYCAWLKQQTSATEETPMSKPRTRLVVHTTGPRTEQADCGCSTYNEDEEQMPMVADYVKDDEKRGKWTGTLVVEGVPTGDGRLIQKNALRWGDLPIPLRWAKEDEGGHLGAVVVGRIEEIARVGSRLEATGTFDLGSPEGREAYRQVREELTTGVSVDLDDVDMEVRVASQLLMEDGFLDPEVDPDSAGALAEAEEDEDGRVTVMEIHADDEMLVTTDARIRAATIVATPAFVEARLFVSDEDEVMVVEEDEEDVPAMTASALDDSRPPSDWFRDPGLTGPTPLVVTEDGRVYGHLATWGTCHTAFPGECVTAPQSGSGYAYFRVGAVRTREGQDVPVGHVTMDTFHAGRRLGATDTAAHYEHTGVAVADVAAGEDVHGIWVAGALRKNVTEEQKDRLRASPLSGDWRRIGGRLELVAALAVNTPGFPIPRAMVASGSVRSLQSIGMLAPVAEVPEEDDASQRALERLVRREREAEEARKRDADKARQRVLVASAASRVRAAR